MTKVMGVTTSVGGLPDRKRMNKLSVDYLETMAAFERAADTNAVDLKLLAKFGQLNNQVFSHGMIDEDQFSENACLLLLTDETKLKQPGEAADLPKTLELINATANQTLADKQRQDVGPFWDERSMRLFNSLCLQ